MTREVAEDVPALRACQHNREVKCFLEWMQDMSEDMRLPVCKALIQRTFELHLDKAQRSPEAEAVFEDYRAAYYRYHETLPPVPNSYKYAKGFVKANPVLCMEEIVRELTPICGKSRKLQKYKREFIREFGDWTLSTHVQIWLSEGMVHGYNFLKRSDAEQPLREPWSSRIESLILLGVSGSNFPFVGQSHEVLCARSLRASMEMFVPSIPKLIEGLEVGR